MFTDAKTMVDNAERALGADHPHVGFWRTGLEFAEIYDMEVIPLVGTHMIGFERITKELNGLDGSVVYLEVGDGVVGVVTTADTPELALLELVRLYSPIFEFPPTHESDFFGYRWTSVEGEEILVDLNDMNPQATRALRSLCHKFLLFALWYGSGDIPEAYDEEVVEEFLANGARLVANLPHPNTL